MGVLVQLSQPDDDLSAQIRLSLSSGKAHISWASPIPSFASTAQTGSSISPNHLQFSSLLKTVCVHLPHPFKVLEAHFNLSFSLTGGGSVAKGQDLLSLPMFLLPLTPHTGLSISPNHLQFLPLSMTVSKHAAQPVEVLAAHIILFCLLLEVFVLHTSCRSPIPLSTAAAHTEFSVSTNQLQCLSLLKTVFIHFLQLFFLAHFRSSLVSLIFLLDLVLSKDVEILISLSNIYNFVVSSFLTLP
mmetsp:Transcript_11433/g.13943  ORF Transcript_11433/g.13943 Transcript_11433/m.13943 type:complete len:243 (+) Transcript_11433:610-1338(+)